MKTTKYLLLIFIITLSFVVKNLYGKKQAPQEVEVLTSITPRRSNIQIIPKQQKKQTPITLSKEKRILKPKKATPVNFEDLLSRFIQSRFARYTSNEIDYHNDTEDFYYELLDKLENKYDNPIEAEQKLVQYLKLKVAYLEGRQQFLNDFKQKAQPFNKKAKVNDEDRKQIEKISNHYWKQINIHENKYKKKIENYWGDFQEEIDQLVSHFNLQLKDKYYFLGWNVSVIY